MRTKFVKDDDGKIWLVYAKDIIVRKVTFDYDKQMSIQEVHNINKQAKDNLMKGLNEHLDSCKSAQTIYSIYNAMNEHYTDTKKSVGINNWINKDLLQNDHDLITEEAFKSIRPGSAYKLDEIVHKSKFHPQKYIDQQRYEERMMGGKTNFRSIAVQDSEQLRQSLLKGKEYISSPKMFLDKQEFAELKQNSRLMHQFYSKDPNAPLELRKSTRLMKKTGTSMKQIKKPIIINYLNQNTKQEQQVRATMSKRIVDFSSRSKSISHNVQKKARAFVPSKLVLNQDLGKNIKMRPKSSIHKKYCNKEFSGMTTQGSYTSSKFYAKTNVTLTRENHIKYLAVHKNK
jgi:hypothetical protein